MKRGDLVVGVTHMINGINFFSGPVGIVLEVYKHHGPEELQRAKIFVNNDFCDYSLDVLRKLDESV